MQSVPALLLQRSVSGISQVVRLAAVVLATAVLVSVSPAAGTPLSTAGDGGAAGTGSARGAAAVCRVD